MATTKDWSAVADVASSTKYFAGGDATDWCVHTPPVWPRVITVYNRGTGALYVAFPSLTSTAAATDDCAAIAASSGRSFVLADDGVDPTPPTFSTWGVDGATHEMDIVFERST